MMKKSLVIVLALGFVPLSSSAWRADTVKVEEMAERFMQWISAPSVVSLVDSMQGPMENATVYPYVRPHFGSLAHYTPQRMAVSSPDRQPFSVGKTVLPPIVWGWAPAASEGDGPRLCFRRFSRSAGVSSADSVRLTRKMGGKALSAYGIPVRKLSDTLCMAYDVWEYGGFGVCNSVRLYDVRKGIVQDSLVLYHTPGTLASAQASYCRGVAPHRTDFHLCYGPLELSFLTYHMCAVLAPSPHYEGGCEFTFLVYTDAAGKARLRVLLPRVLSAVESQLISRLEQALETLPAGSFGSLCTIDGRIFPGRYLHALYKPKLNRWYFEDYLFDYRQKAVEEKGHWEVGTDWERPTYSYSVPNR